MKKGIYNSKNSLYESLLIEGYSINFIDREEAQEYLRWVSYIPEFWNIDEISTKPAGNLTKQQISYFQKYLEDQKKGISIFTNFLYEGGDKNPKTILEVHRYIKSHNLEDLMLSKMSNSEKLSCIDIERQIAAMDCETLVSKMNQLKQIPKSERSITEEYILTYSLIPAFNKMVEDRIKPVILEDSHTEIDSINPSNLLKI